MKAKFYQILSSSSDILRIAVARPWRWLGLPAIASLLAQARQAGHRATAGDRIRDILEKYVAGSDTRVRGEGQPYPWSQQSIRDIFELKLSRFIHIRIRRQESECSGHGAWDIEFLRSVVRCRKGIE
jgi:hypothetical protein